MVDMVRIRLFPLTLLAISFGYELAWSQDNENDNGLEGNLPAICVVSERPRQNAITDIDWTKEEKSLIAMKESVTGKYVLRPTNSNMFSNNDKFNINASAKFATYQSASKYFIMHQANSYTITYIGNNNIDQNVVFYHCKYSNIFDCNHRWQWSESLSVTNGLTSLQAQTVSDTYLVAKDCNQLKSQSCNDPNMIKMLQVEGDPKVFGTYKYTKCGFGGLPIYFSINNIDNIGIELAYNWSVSSLVFYDTSNNKPIALCTETMDYQYCRTWIFIEYSQTDQKHSKHINSESNLNINGPSMRVSTNVRLIPIVAFNGNKPNRVLSENNVYFDNLGIMNSQGPNINVLKIFKIWIKKHKILENILIPSLTPHFVCEILIMGIIAILIGYCCYQRGKQKVHDEMRNSAESELKAFIDLSREQQSWILKNRKKRERDQIFNNIYNYNNGSYHNLASKDCDSSNDSEI